MIWLHKENPGRYTSGFFLCLARCFYNREMVFSTLASAEEQWADPDIIAGFINRYNVA